MKICDSQIISIRVIIILLLITRVNLCFSADKDSIPEYDKQILQVEELWKQGNIHEYYAKTANIVGDIMANSQKIDQNKAAAKLFDNLISKETKITDVGIDDLSAMQKLASYLISNVTVSIEERRTNVLLLAKYLGKIRKEKVPNFKPKPVVANVSPPVGTPGMAGMRPEAISDPVARAKYEASIRENQENALMNSRQSELRNIDVEMSRPIINYIIQTFHASDISSANFIDCMNSAELDDKEKEKVVNHVSSK
jgi:hypothetical protein